MKVVWSRLAILAAAASVAVSDGVVLSISCDSDGSSLMGSH